MQDGQSTQNVTLRRVRATTRAVEEHYVLYILSACVCVCVCVYSLSYPGRKAHAPYYIVICGMSSSTKLFPHYLIQRQNFWRKYWTQKTCVIIFSTTSVWNISHSKNNSARYYRKWTNVKCQLDATRWFYWCILSSTCFGYIRSSSGALEAELQHMVFCTEFLDGWWSWEPLRRSCLRCRWCRAAPSAP